MAYTYIDEDQIDVELKCSICDEPFQSPMNCRACGNTYCQKCVDDWLEQQMSCPSCRQLGNQFVPVISRVVLNQLNRLLVRCTLCQQDNIQRSNFNDHMSCTCPRQTVSCTDSCGWSGLRENLEQHLIQCRRNQVYAAEMWKYLRNIGMVICAIVLFFLLKSGERK